MVNSGALCVQEMVFTIKAGMRRQLIRTALRNFPLTPPSPPKSWEGERVRGRLAGSSYATFRFIEP
jgi:hypothetical protein